MTPQVGSQAFTRSTSPIVRNHLAAAAVSNVIQPCSFQIDASWPGDIGNKILKYVDNVVRIVRSAINAFSNGVKTFLKWFPGSAIPAWAKQMIQKALALLKKVGQKVQEFRTKIFNLMGQLLAPWIIRSAGENILNCLAPKTFDFADYLQRSQLATARTWQSDASRDFFHAIDRQHEAAKGAAEGTRKFGMEVKSLGDQAVKTTMSFFAEVITAAVGIATASVGLPTVVGTPPSAFAILGQTGKVLAAILVLVKTATSIASQADSFATAAAGAVPGGSWPDDVNG